ncbi:chromatin binding protein [Scheffersomyces stipitis CBS 6054]|uniref:Chromatin binding protein n=1 Tax=Scheffersomyces stipitis (strain ATCC 58785 / CBS 6054 / NBRC 10063 / NRRL Y-11545) TaxID=322104 RepID=A3LP31_PICST|nr:chromatin binding protein [Scheffersomyces stipitis CBS 6054]ABN64978.2 chromatin binding protein [Scheffersomyces stipitis CBS 6054]
MNLALQDPFAVAKEYPDTLANTLHYGHSVVIQFNQKGDYLASGLSDGSILVYDLTSNGGVVAHLHENSHIRPVTSISWSRCGRYILSSSQDWSCKLWDLSKVNRDEVDVELDDMSAVIRTVKFDGPIWSASMHPEDPFNEEDMASTAAVSEDEPRKKKKAEKHVTLVTTFTPNDGSYIFTGTSKGWLNVHSTQTLQLVHSVKMANANIKNLVISPNGRKLAINSSDRIVRQISLPDLINVANPDEWDFEIDHKYQDVVNRLQWNSVAFNHNAEFLVASSYGQSSHDLYIWETSLGSLIKILEGSNEELIDVKWNYSRCTIGSTGLDSGMIYLWSVQFPQKWSALAPDFVEIEENIEYDEKEDEFDIIDEVALNKKRLEEEDMVVDVITRENVDARGFDTMQQSFVIPINYEKTVLG